MARPLTTSSLEDAIAADEVAATACGGHERRGVWRHVCPACARRVPAFALVDARPFGSVPSDFVCDNCWTALERDPDSWAALTAP